MEKHSPEYEDGCCGSITNRDRSAEFEVPIPELIFYLHVQNVQDSPFREECPPNHESSQLREPLVYRKTSHSVTLQRSRTSHRHTEHSNKRTANFVKLLKGKKYKIKY